MRDYWYPLLKLQLAKQPVMTVAEGLDGSELSALIGVPIAASPEADWRLAVENKEQLDSLIDGAKAVLDHGGTFPEFAGWRGEVDRLQKQA